MPDIPKNWRDFAKLAPGKKLDAKQITKIEATQFTAMQELATAFICMQSFNENKKFSTVYDIINDQSTKKELIKIFKNAFKFDVKPTEKGPNGKPKYEKSFEYGWLYSFYQQNQIIMKKFADASFTVANREGGFMKYISDLVRIKFGVSKKDSWDPADIWLMKNEAKVEKVITEKLKGNTTQTIVELNNIMRKMYKDRELVGLSLKKITGKIPKYEELNLEEKFFKLIETKKGDYDFDIGPIAINFGLKDEKTNVTFGTQDTTITITTTKGLPVAKFQIKGNSTSNLCNLKIEVTFTGAGSKAGKAPLNLMPILLKNYNKEFNNDNNKFPINAKDFDNVKSTYVKMFQNVQKTFSKTGIDTGVIKSTDFVENVKTVFENKKQFYIANSKLMQLNLLNTIANIPNPTSNPKRDEFLTDVYYLAQKIGRTVFDFGPFGKIS